MTYDINNLKFDEEFGMPIGEEATVLLNGVDNRIIN